MTRGEDIKAEVGTIVRRNMPSVDVVRIDPKPVTDSDGEPSLRITVVVRQHPPRDESRKLSDVVDQFRTWLAKRDDDRFPYFRLISEQEERELQQTDS